MLYIYVTSRCVLLGLKPRARSASGFRPNKTRTASFLNGFKNVCIISQILYKNLYIKIFI